MSEVFRINKTKNYTVMSNYHLQDRNLSFKAKGLLSYMLSLPSDWNYSIKGLSCVSMEGVKAIKSILKELEDNSYLVRFRKQGSHGRFYYEYNIYEVPCTQEGITDIGSTLDDTQINTNVISTNNKDKLDKSLNPIINELVKRCFIDYSDLDLYRYDELFDELLCEYEYKQVITVISYVIGKWNCNKGVDEDMNKIDNKFSYFKASVINNLVGMNKDIVMSWEDDCDDFKW